MPDRSNGYEAAARRFISGRGTTGTVGAAVVREWARKLPLNASVLDLGCGSGFPISDVLVTEGFTVSGVDASATMIAAFRQNFPQSPAEFVAAEESNFFGAQYDAVIAWGLIFLLSPEIQRTLIGKVAQALKTGGEFLFTAPKQACTWLDALTGLPSVSLGLDVYRETLGTVGMVLTENRLDEGDNFYYFAAKR